MQGAKLIQQVKRKQKKMTGVLRKLMVVFGVFFAVSYTHLTLPTIA